jgi:hypothetical protein
MCFMWIWEHRLFPYIANEWLIFITETKCLYCDVRIYWPCPTQAVRRRLLTATSSRTPGFDPRSPRVRSRVDRVALGQVTLRVTRLSPVSVIAPMLHTKLHRHVCLTSGANERSLETFQKAVLFRKFGSISYKSNLTFLSGYLKRHAAICSADTDGVWLLPISDYVKDRNCFQWKWREFLEKVWPEGRRHYATVRYEECVGSACGYLCIYCFA